MALVMELAFPVVHALSAAGCVGCICIGILLIAFAFGHSSLSAAVRAPSEELVSVMRYASKIKLQICPTDSW